MISCAIAYKNSSVFKVSSLNYQASDNSWKCDETNFLSEDEMDLDQSLLRRSWSEESVLSYLSLKHLKTKNFFTDQDVLVGLVDNSIFESARLSAYLKNENLNTVKDYQMAWSPKQNLKQVASLKLGQIAQKIHWPGKIFCLQQVDTFQNTKSPGWILQLFKGENYVLISTATFEERQICLAFCFTKDIVLVNSLADMQKEALKEGLK